MLTINATFLNEASRIVAVAIAKGWATPPRKMSIDEYTRMRRAKNLEHMRKKRAELKAAKLTTNGTAPKRKTLRDRLDAAAYMRSYRATHPRKDK